MGSACCCLRMVGNGRVDDAPLFRSLAGVGQWETLETVETAGNRWKRLETVGNGPKRFEPFKNGLNFKNTTVSHTVPRSADHRSMDICASGIFPDTGYYGEQVRPRSVHGGARGKPVAGPWKAALVGVK
eukprot:13610955-Alexandrium_andersonii.AAC.1